ncbi:MAG: hypothetical protein KKF44_00185 [Nanoarchaeota archaeon]|nr:hypothetical protein [Nanoarchaeota archaeon]
MKTIKRKGYTAMEIILSLIAVLVAVGLILWLLGLGPGKDAIAGLDFFTKQSIKDSMESQGCETIGDMKCIANYNAICVLKNGRLIYTLFEPVTKCE